ALAGTVTARSLSDFARGINYSRQAISEALSGRPRTVSEEVIGAICQVCNADESIKQRLFDKRAEVNNPRSPDPVPVDPSPPDLESRNPSLFSSPSENPSPPSLPPPGPPVPPDPARWKWLLAAASVVALVAGLVVWKSGVIRDDQLVQPQCGVSSGIRLNDKVDGECIGIAEGGYPFNDPSKAKNNDDRSLIEGINDVEKRIKVENDAAAGTSRYVKIVLLTPLTVSQDKDTLSAISLKEILHCLQGSYTALYRVNHSPDFGDPSAVEIQLLLANQGSQQDADPDFLNGILRESQPAHPVVAVIGLGSSFSTTMTTVEYIAKQGIPLVSAVTSADNLTNLHLLWSVSPSNDQYVQALNVFLGTKQEKDILKSGIIVYDQNPDPFTQSLAQDY
ncbi:MAG: hypothetical protein ACRDR6_25360, partial [Pseudonocardiaceae bacterium]